MGCVVESNLHISLINLVPLNETECEIDSVGEYNELWISAQHVGQYAFMSHYESCFQALNTRQPLCKFGACSCPLCQSVSHLFVGHFKMDA